MPSVLIYLILAGNHISNALGWNYFFCRWRSWCSSQVSVRSQIHFLERQVGTSLKRFPCDGRYAHADSKKRGSISGKWKKHDTLGIGVGVHKMHHSRWAVWHLPPSQLAFTGHSLSVGGPLWTSYQTLGDTILSYAHFTGEDTKFGQGKAIYPRSCHSYLATSRFEPRIWVPGL